MNSEQLSREVSKLIAALDKEWREELGGPEATLTETVLRKVHRLLTMLNQNGVHGEPEHLQSQIDPAWLELHPWATPYVIRIDNALAAMSHNLPN